MVIVGNRYESQLSAIEMNAKCLIISDADVTKSIKSIATKAGCTIIKTPMIPLQLLGYQPKYASWPFHETEQSSNLQFRRRIK